MNGEITHVSKLVPTPILRNKQNDLKDVSANVPASKEQQVTAKAEVKTQALTASTEAKEAKEAKESKEAKEAALDSVKSAAETGNSIFQATNRSLKFEVDDSTQKVVVKVVDSNTGDVVRQIPSEEMLDFVKRMQELEGDNQGTILQDRV
ncbi:MAG: flagellar protein FlaG [Methylobacter sp.]